MLTLQEGKNTVEIYNSIEELPIRNWVAYQKYSILDSGVGSTFEDVMHHFEKLDYYLQNNKIEEAKRERLNMHQGLYAQYEEINSTMLTFACFVRSINGQRCDDLTEDGLQHISEQLQKIDIRIGKLTELLRSVKKN